MLRFKEFWREFRKEMRSCWPDAIESRFGKGAKESLGRGGRMRKCAFGIWLVLFALVLFLLNAGANFCCTSIQRHRMKQDSLFQAKKHADVLADQYARLLREYDSDHNSEKLFTDFMAFRTDLDNVQKELSASGVETPEITRAKGRIRVIVPGEAYQIEAVDVRKIASELERLAGKRGGRGHNP